MGNDVREVVVDGNISRLVYNVGFTVADIGMKTGTVVLGTAVEIVVEGAIVVEEVKMFVV